MPKVTDSVSFQRHPRHETLFAPTSIGNVDLKNRIALAPMTRVSATADGIPTFRVGAYYRVFADGGFGLLITEGLYIDDQTSRVTSSSLASRIALRPRRGDKLSRASMPLGRSSSPN